MNPPIQMLWHSTGNPAMRIIWLSCGKRDNTRSGGGVKRVAAENSLIFLGVAERKFWATA